MLQMDLDEMLRNRTTTDIETKPPLYKPPLRFFDLRFAKNKRMKKWRGVLFVANRFNSNLVVKIHTNKTYK